MPLLNVLPPACVLKADQWVLLNRHDAVLLVEAPKMLETILTEHMYPVNPNDVASVLRTLFKKVCLHALFVKMEVYGYHAMVITYR